MGNVGKYLTSLGYVMTVDDDLSSIYTKGSVEVKISVGVKAILEFELKINGERILYNYLSNIDSVEKLMDYIKLHHRKEVIKKILN